MLLDSIRSQARSVAWKYSDGEGKNYNPFARTSRSGKPRNNDEESLQHIRTADSVPTREETERRSQNKQDLVPRRETAPADSEFYETPQLSTRSPVEVNGNGFTMANEEKEYGDETQQVASNIGMTNTMSDDDNAAGPRKRKFLSFGKKHKDEEDTGLERTEFEKKRRPNKPKTFMSQLRATLFGSWINLLLVCVPIGIALNYANLPDKAKPSIFVINFVAIVPLAAMLSYATEELAMYVGETLGGLLNASFGNATELIGKDDCPPTS